MLINKYHTFFFALLLNIFLFGQEKSTITFVGLVHDGNKNYTKENLYKYVDSLKADKIFYEAGNKENLSFILKAQLFLGLAHYTDEKKFIDSLSKTRNISIVEYDYNFDNRYRYIRWQVKSEQNMVKKLNELNSKKLLSAKELRLLEDYNENYLSYSKLTNGNTIEKNTNSQVAQLSEEYLSKYFNNLGTIVKTNPNLAEFRNYMVEYEKFNAKRNNVMAENILKNIGESKNIVIVCGLLHVPYLRKLLKAKLNPEEFTIK